jgi:hypothetical protein
MAKLTRTVNLQLFFLYITFDTCYYMIGDTLTIKKRFNMLQSHANTYQKL